MKTLSLSIISLFNCCGWEDTWIWMQLKQRILFSREWHVVWNGCAWEDTWIWIQLKQRILFSFIPQRIQFFVWGVSTFIYLIKHNCWTKKWYSREWHVVWNGKTLSRSGLGLFLVCNHSQESKITKVISAMLNDVTRNSLKILLSSSSNMAAIANDQLISCLVCFPDSSSSSRPVWISESKSRGRNPP